MIHRAEYTHTHTHKGFLNGVPRCAAGFSILKKKLKMEKEKNGRGHKRDRRERRKKFIRFFSKNHRMVIKLRS